MKKSLFVSACGGCIGYGAGQLWALGHPGLCALVLVAWLASLFA